MVLNFKKSSEKFSSFLRLKNTMFCFFRNKKSHYMERYPPTFKLKGCHITKGFEVNKTDLYTLVSYKTGIPKDEINEIFQATSKLIFEYLGKVSEGEIRKVYIMNGIHIESKFASYDNKIMPDGTKINTKTKIKLLPKISKRYKDEINQNR